MKICNRCKQEKPLDEFYKAKRLAHGRSHVCKQCIAPEHKAARLAKLDHYRDVQTAGREAKRARYRAWKEEQKCLICSEDDSYCLDLHHLDPTEKDLNIGDVVSSANWDKLMEEIAKCVVLCSNCHRKVHANKITLLP